MRKKGKSSQIADGESVSPLLNCSKSRCSSKGFSKLSRRNSLMEKALPFAKLL